MFSIHGTSLLETWRVGRVQISLAPLRVFALHPPTMTAAAAAVTAAVYKNILACIGNLRVRYTELEHPGCILTPDPIHLFPCRRVREEIFGCFAAFTETFRTETEATAATVLPITHIYIR